MYLLLDKIILVFFLFVFFYLLGQSANLIVMHMRRLGRKIGLNMYFMGLLLGLFTSLPEFTIGINSIINGIEAVSFGNLFGGTIVVLGFVLGINIVLNKTISTNGHGHSFYNVMIYLTLPILIGLDGQFGIIDGTLLIMGYLLLLYNMYRNEKEGDETKPIKRNRKKLYMNIFWIICGVTGLVIFSTLIVKSTELLLSEVGVSSFALGVILFALGTNLPEITIALKSVQNHSKELSYSNLLGSAAANPFIIGLLSFIEPLKFKVGSSYLFMAFFSILLFVLLYFFYRSGNKFSRKEGFMLIWVYLLFLSFEVMSQIIQGVSS